MIATIFPVKQKARSSTKNENGGEEDGGLGEDRKELSRMNRPREHSVIVGQY